MITKIKKKVGLLLDDRRLSSILTGSVWTLLALIFSAGFGLICSVVVARFYGPEVMGTLAVINAYLTVATVLAVFGTDISILRIVPEHFAKYSLLSAFRIYRKTHLLVISISLVIGLFSFFFSRLIAFSVFSKPHLTAFFMLASFFIVFKASMILNTQALRGFLLVRWYAFMLILPQGLNLLLLLVLGFLVESMAVPIYSQLGAYAIAGMAGWIIIKSTFRVPVEAGAVIQNVGVADILSISMPMLMTTAMMFIIAQTGIIMLGMFRSEAEVGYYTIAARMSIVTAYIIGAVNSMVGPKFSELFHSGRIDDLFYVAKKSAKLIFLTTVPILLFFIAFGKPLLRMIFGDEFVAAYFALVLLSIGQFVYAVSGATFLFMNMTGNQKMLRNIMIFAALSNIGLNLLLIPKNGIIGAAVAALSCLIVLNLLTLTYIKFKFGKTTGYFPWLTKIRP